MASCKLAHVSSRSASSCIAGRPKASQGAAGEVGGATYVVRADLAAGDSVHLNHFGGIRGVFGPSEVNWFDEGGVVMIETAMAAQCSELEIRSEAAKSRMPGMSGHFKTGPVSGAAWRAGTSATANPG